jgi:ATP-dependent helicase HepA
MTTWKPGDRLIHRYNPELGAGRIRAVEGRTVVVEFPGNDTVLRLAAGTDALRPLVFAPGSRAVLRPGGETVIVESLPSGETALLTDGREVPQADLWPLEEGESLFDRLARGDLDAPDEFALRLDALHLAAIREADGLGSFLGGRIRLFPHQLHVAERATRSNPVRWLLADEVGLGKTVEACLILNHLLRTGRAERTLVVAPATLTVQWLGELWRKYHQVFVLLDKKRLADVERDYGRGFNPFDAHRQVVVALETLCENRRLTEQAVEAGIDLLIVDEAHHLRRPRGHAGDASYRAVEPVAALGRHVLLLTATPLEDDAHGFFRLLQLLRPEEFEDEDRFSSRLECGEPLPPCTSATRRSDIGGLPPREPFPVDLPDDEHWGAVSRLESVVRGAPAPHAAARREKARRMRGVLASGAALEALLPGRETDLRERARAVVRTDPRVRWLARQAPYWRSLGQKTLVFVAHRETLELLRDEMSRQAQLRVSVFHEDLSPGQRDIEVAQFRLPVGASMLVSTECGGEGRNFEFCTRLVLFDLPWNPMTVEQRIGRLDRIGRQIPVEIVYFRPPGGVGAVVTALYESLGLFREPQGGLERELAGVEQAIEQLALSDRDPLDTSRFAEIVAGAREANDRIREAAFHELHREPYEPSLADSILARIPAELEELTRDVVLGVAERLHLHVEEHREGTRHSIEFGRSAKVGSLPGVPEASSFLGTFRREEAVQDETIDFYASGHALVEGILAHLEDSSGGCVVLLDARGDDSDERFGLLALFKSGPGFEAVAVDANGREQAAWADLLTRRPVKTRRVKPESWTRLPGWPKLIRSMARKLEGRGRPVAVAAFRIGP